MIGAFSLLVVASELSKHDKQILGRFKIIYKFTQAYLAQEERDALGKFREILLRRHENANNVDDVFLGISNTALLRAVSEFLQQESGPYESSEDEQKYIEDYGEQIMEPCKALAKVWTTAPEYYIRERKAQNIEFIHAVQDSIKLYESLEEVKICKRLIDESDSTVKKSFEYTLEHGP